MPVLGRVIPKKGTSEANPAAEHWVPVPGKPHLWRDENSHPDPAHQRMKYAPPIPLPPWLFVP